MAMVFAPSAPANVPMAILDTFASNPALIPVRLEPSPINEVAVTLPPTTILLSTDRPVVAFVSWRVFEVVFPKSDTDCSVVTIPVSSLPSPCR